MRKLVVDGIEMLDIRDYTQSLELYGRGLLLPIELKRALLTAIKEV